MASVKHNHKQFEAQLTAMQQELSIKGVAPVIRSKVIRLFEKIVSQTPQWSGAAASSWTMSGSGGRVPSGYFASDEPLYSKGMDPAVGAAYANNQWINGQGAAESILSEGVQITNPQPYIEYLEEGHADERPLREVNRPGLMVANAIASESGTFDYGWAKMLYAGLRLGG